MAFAASKLPGIPMKERSVDLWKFGINVIFLKLKLYSMHIKLAVLALLMVCTFAAKSQVNSIANGDWASTSTWDCACVPNASSGLITIGHNVTVSTAISADEVFVNIGGALIVSNTGAFTVQNGSGNDLELFNDGLDYGFLTVNGTLIVDNLAVVVGADQANANFNANSIYRHLYTTTQGSIPVANWAATSTVEINGYSVTGPLVATAGGNWNQSFGNVHFDSPLGLGGIFDFAGRLTSIGGNLRIISTGSGRVQLSTNQNPVINVTGDLSVEGTSRLVIATTGTNTELNVRDFSFSSTLAAGSNAATTGTTLIRVSRDFLMNASGGTFVLNSGSGSGVGTLRIGRNFTLTAGTVTETSSSSGQGNVVFVGVGNQTYSNSGTISETINFTVQNGSRVSMGTSAFTGLGSFSLNAGGTILLGSPDGLMTGSSLGNVRVGGTRTYAANSNIVYNGTTQNLGNEWSSGALVGVAVNLEINGGANVTNDNIGTTSLVGVLSLQNGTLNIGNSNTLTIQGVFTSTTSGFIGGSTTSNLTFAGSGALSTLNFATGSQSLNDLTMGRSGTLVLGTNLTVGNSIALTAGNLDISGRTLTFNGAAISSASTGLISSSTSNLTIGGSTYSGPIPFSGAGNQINNLTLSTTGGSYSLNSSLTVVGTLFLTSGTLNHISGLTMGTGSTISRAGGIMTGTAPGATTSYNVSYTGVGTTGVELPLAASRLNNLNIDASGTVTLDKNVTVNGSVNLFSGSLASSTFNITLAGASRSWNQTFGGFTPGTGSVIVTGSYTIVGISPVFGNLTVNSGASLTMLLGTVSPPDPGNVFITGDFTVNAGSTFNANNGTVYFTGSAVQNFAGGGKNFNNITIDKSAGSVSLSSAVNLIGVLDIETSTTLTTNSHLTLISNASGTASIASIPTGGAVSGDVTVQRYAPGTGRDFRDISSPVFELDLRPTVAQIIASGITITGNFTGSSFPCAGCATNNASLFFYDESVAGAQRLGYTAHPPSGGNSSTSILSPGRGYALLYRNELGATTLSLTAPINSGSRGLPVSYTTTAGGASEDGWNLVGNPYPSQIDWDAPGWTKTAIQGNQISVWDPNKGASGGYRVWNGSAGDLTNGQIALGQGFWVKATNGTAALSLTEAVKTSVTTSFYRTKSRIEFLEVSLQNTESGDEDNMFIQLSESGQLAFDPTDGVKKMNPSTNLFSALGGGVKLSINSIKELPVSERIHVGLSDVSVGVHRLSLKIEGSEFSSVPVYLFDKHLGLSVDMKKGAYLFDIDESNIQQSSDRFYLFFSESSSHPAVSSGIQVFPVPVENDLTVLVTDEEIAPEIQVIDQLGRRFGYLEIKEDSGARIGRLDMSGAAPGVYFVRASRLGKPLIVKFVKR